MEGLCLRAWSTLTASRKLVCRLCSRLLFFLLSADELISEVLGVSEEQDKHDSGLGLLGCGRSGVATEERDEEGEPEGPWQPIWSRVLPLDWPLSCVAFSSGTSGPVRVRTGSSPWSLLAMVARVAK